MMSTAPRKPRTAGATATHPKLTTKSGMPTGSTTSTAQYLRPGMSVRSTHQAASVPMTADAAVTTTTSRTVFQSSWAVRWRKTSRPRPSCPARPTEWASRRRKMRGRASRIATPTARTRTRRGRALERRLAETRPSSSGSTSTTAISARRPAGVRTHRSWASWRSATALDPSPSSLSETGSGASWSSGVSPCAVVTPEPMAYSKLSLWAMIS